MECGLPEDGRTAEDSAEAAKLVPLGPEGRVGSQIEVVATSTHTEEAPFTKESPGTEHVACKMSVVEDNREQQCKSPFVQLRRPQRERPGLL